MGAGLLLSIRKDILSYKREYSCILKRRRMTSIFLNYQLAFARSINTLDVAIGDSDKPEVPPLLM
jgi:hypothetical protein